MINGRSNNFMFHVDFEKPSIIGMPSNITQNADSGLPMTKVNWTEPKAIDNSGSNNLTSNLSPGSLFTIGKTVVEYIAVDPSGNKALETFTVIIEGMIRSYE